MRITILILVLLISSCSMLSTKTLSIGLREQYVEKNKQTSTDEYSVYDVKESPVKGENFSLYRDRDPAKHKLVAQYKINKDGVITPVSLEPPPRSVSRIYRDELTCIECIKPKRYRAPSGYLAYPLLIVATPLDLVATAVAVPIAGVGITVFAVGTSINCVINNIHPCHE